MTSNRTQLRALLDDRKPIPARLVDDMMVSDDREDQADAYDCLTRHWGEIRPEPEICFALPLILDFLCCSITSPMRNESLDSNVLSSYDAARELYGLLQAYNGRGGSESIVAEFIKRIDQTFLAGDESVRSCIEMGFLEHVLEHPELRKHFAHWANHPEMQEAYRYALAWGLAHEKPQN